MGNMLYLDESMLLGEGASRKCYSHPKDKKKCLKIEKKSGTINRQDLESYHIVKSILNSYLAGYDDELVETNMGAALVCELIFDEDGQPSESFAEYKQTQKPSPQLKDQFLHFFNLLQKNDLFFYDFNPKNFIVQKVPDGVRLRYIDLKSFKKTRTAFAIEKIPYFAKRKLKRRIERFIKKYLTPPDTETSLL